MPRIVLGTSSKWRRSLFERHFSNVEYSFMAPDIDERAIRHADAATLTRLIANAKADKLVEELMANDPEADVLLVCMDQVVSCDGEIREKPESAEVVRRYLESYSRGAKAECVNGCVVHNFQTGQRYAANEVASVTFMPLAANVIEDAIRQGRIFSSAGAFAIEDPLFAPLVKEVDGARDAIIGLPLRTLRQLLAEASSEHALTCKTLPRPPTPGLVVRVMQPADESAARSLLRRLCARPSRKARLRMIAKHSAP